MCVGAIGRVVGVVDAGQHVVEVEVGSARRRVNASLLEPEALAPGTYVLINIGMAMEIVEEEEALAHLRLLEEIERSYGNDLAPAS